MFVACIKVFGACILVFVACIKVSCACILGSYLHLRVLCLHLFVCCLHQGVLCLHLSQLLASTCFVLADPKFVKRKVDTACDRIADGMWERHEFTVPDGIPDVPPQTVVFEFQYIVSACVELLLDYSIASEGKSFC